MGTSYNLGQGVPKNYVQAYKWFALAKSATKPGSKIYSTASSDIKRLSFSMPAPQIAQAQALAYAWVKAHEK